MSTSLDSMAAAPVAEALMVSTADADLPADLVMPERATALVIFAHGSQSGRRSTRNQYVADRLQSHGFATLLPDLLTASEADTGQLRFDIQLLARRLNAIARWAWQDARFAGLPTVYFGAGTGAAAALIAAAGQGGRVKAIVSRGGRPDLAIDYLDKINAPTLLLVGGKDHEVLQRNEEALAELNRESRLDVVPGASALFEEPGAMAKVAERTLQWFTRQLQEKSRAPKRR